MRTLLPAARSNGNTAVAFLQRASHLLADRGRLGLVVPRSLTFSGEWEAIRSDLFDRVAALIEAGEAFKGVKLEQILLACGPERSERVESGRLLASGLSRASIDKEVWRSLGVWVTGLSETEAGILERVKGMARLGDLVRVYRGLGLQGSLASRGELAVYGGAEVGVFRLLKERGWIGEAALDGAAARVLLPKVMAQNVVAHVKRPKPHAWIKAAVDWSGRAVPLDTINCLVPVSDGMSLVEVAVLLNSRFASWYATRFIFADAHRTMHFDRSYAGRIPVPGFRTTLIRDREGRPCSAYSWLLELVEEGKGGLDAGVVDGIVYSLLGLDEEQRAEIDSYFA